MMSECWVRANPRPILAAMLLPALAAAAALCGVLLSSTWWLRLLYSAVVVVALPVILSLLWFMLAPRLSRQGAWLLVRLRLGPALRVPADKVEMFFLGQGPSMAGPGADQQQEDEQPQTANIVVRLAEADQDLHRRAVEQRLGNWCDGYITLRGAHCQPVTADLVLDLNRRLVQLHRELRGGGEGSTARRADVGAK
jgi:hypothetical protein